MASSSNISCAIDPSSSPLTDGKLSFLNEALRRSGTGYTDDDFATFMEWGLKATIREESDYFAVLVSPETGRVNAEWELHIEKGTGRVTEIWVATLEPPPQADCN